jgi:hypothetical protein
VVGSLNIKGSTISHMAAVHPGHQLPGAHRKKKMRSTRRFEFTFHYVTDLQTPAEMGNEEV